jgi:integrase
MIKKIGANLWQIKLSIRVAGKDYPVSKQERFTGTKLEAEARKSELIKAIRDTGSAKSSLISTFGEALQIYAHKKGKESPPDLSRIAKLNADLGQVPIEDFTDKFERYLEVIRITHTCRGKLPSSATINRIIEIAKAVFNLLVALGYVEKNPITNQRFPKTKQKPRDRYLEPDERLRLLNAIQTHRPYLLPFIEFNLAVPCRKGELINLKREAYSAFTNTIYVPDSKTGEPIHKPVPDATRRYIQSIPAACPWLFYRQEKDGSFHPLGDFRRAWRYCLKKAGVMHATIHDLRHVAATDLYANGNSERMIMDIAGWKTTMLSTYRHKNSLRSAQDIRFSPPPSENASSGPLVISG